MMRESMPKSHKSSARKEIPCWICASVWQRVIDPLLSAGHSYLCLYWEMRRRGYYSTLKAFAKHHAQHTPFFLQESPLPVVPAHWWYVAPWPATPTPPEIVLVRGLPGTGKTRFANGFARTHRHLEADHFYFAPTGAYQYHKESQQKAYLWCLSQAHHTLENQTPIVVANTFLNKDALDEYLDLADFHNVPLRIFNMPDTLPRTRAEAQERGTHLLRHISLSQLGTMRRKWCTLVLDEGNHHGHTEDVALDRNTWPQSLGTQEEATKNVYYWCTLGLCPQATAYPFEEMDTKLWQCALERYPYYH